MFIRDSRRSYRTYSYAELILITDLCLFRTPVGVTELVHIQNLGLFRTPIGVTELRLMLQSLNLFLYESTCKYYGTYTDLTEHVLVLQNLDMYFRSYTCLTEHILILRILYWSYGTYTCLTELIRVLRNLYGYFRA